MISKEKHIKRLLSSEIIENRGEEKEVLAENLETLRDFDLVLTAEGLSESALYNYANHLRKFAIFLNKPFKEAIKKDLKIYFAGLHRKSSPRSMLQSKSQIKRSYKWLYDIEDKYPKCIRWIKTSLVDNDLTHDQPLIEEEVKTLVETARNPRDRAMIQVTYEGALRKGELTDLKIKNVEFTKYGAAFKVNGKTGTRMIPLINSAPSLQLWLNHHPSMDDPDAYLWVPIGSYKGRKTLNYGFLDKLLKKLSRDTGIKKNVYPHLLRYSQLTMIAKKKSDSILKFQRKSLKHGKTRLIYRDRKANCAHPYGLGINSRSFSLRFFQA